MNMSDREPFGIAATVFTRQLVVYMSLVWWDMGYYPWEAWRGSMFGTPWALWSVVTAYAGWRFLHWAKGGEFMLSALTKRAGRLRL